MRVKPTKVLAILSAKSVDNFATVRRLADEFAATPRGAEGAEELRVIATLVADYADRIVIDPSVVRGLEYYTGLVYEAELTFEVKDEAGRPVRFGSVGGGGRYDGLGGAVPRRTRRPRPAFPSACRACSRR